MRQGTGNQTWQDSVPLLQAEMEGKMVFDHATFQAAGSRLSLLQDNSDEVGLASYLQSISGLVYFGNRRFEPNGILADRLRCPLGEPFDNSGSLRRVDRTRKTQ